MFYSNSSDITFWKMPYDRIWCCFPDFTGRLKLILVCVKHDRGKINKDLVINRTTSMDPSMTVRYGKTIYMG